jgi:hypothetical protein
MDIDPKQQIEQAIAAARDGVGAHVDELDEHLRANFDPKVLVKSYAPHLVAGGAVVGVVVGFAFPKVFRRLITWGVPIGMIAAAVASKRKAAGLPAPATR